MVAVAPRPTVMCMRSGCSRNATLAPRIKFHYVDADLSPEVRQRGPQMMGEMNFEVPLCERCSRVTDISDLLNDKNWLAFANQLEASGRAVPSRESSRLDFRPLHEVMEAVNG